MATKNTASDFFKSFSNYNVPTVDFNELFNLGRRNLEACSAANQVIIEGAQAVNKRGAEVCQNNVEKCLSASRDILSSASPEANTQKQSEVTKDVLESCVSSAREITEMVSKSAFEAFDVINKRCAEAMDEAAKIAKKAA